MSGRVSAQQSVPTLTLDSLVARLLEVNYSIRLSDKRAELTKSNITVSQFFPTLGLALRQSQQGASNSESTNTLGASLQFGWRLFDGLAMFNTNKLHQGRYDLSLIEKRAAIETQLTELVTQYYLIISLQNRTKVAEESVLLSQIRYNEARLKYEIGASSGLEKELAKTDYNTDSSTLIKQREALDIAYNTLNGMLLYDHQQRQYIQDTITLIDQLNRTDIEPIIEYQNVQILAAKQGCDLSDIDLQLARAGRYPTLDFGAAYNYGVNDALNPRSDLRANSGYNWGFTLGMNLFNGMQVNQKIASAKIGQQIAQMSLEDVNQKVITEFNRQWINYASNLRQINFETENARAMRFNLETAMKRYKLGDLSGIDLRIIQQQYLDAVDRKINVIYQAKASEIRILTLAGALI